MSASPPPDEERRLQQLANRLHAERPAPHPAFRGRLHRRLASRGFPKGRPPRLWALGGTAGAAGAVLLGAAASLV